MELLINMTIGGTAAACLILLVKLLLKDRLTPKWHFYLWVILAVRLMVPGLPQSEISLLNNMPVTQVSPASETSTVNSPQNIEALKDGYLEGNVVIKSPVFGAERSRSFTVPAQRFNVLAFAWAAGAALMAAYFLAVSVVFQRQTKTMPVCKDREILALFESCKKKVGIGNRSIALRTGGTTPMLQGFLQPSILIPEGYECHELRYIFIHELCHAKHRDILINRICCGFLCVYWFNPILWLCFFMVRRDLEVLCDEQVIKITGERKEYAKTLLKTASKQNRFLLATTPMQNGEKEVSRRIRHIASFRKPKFLVSALALLIVLVTGAVCLTNASENTVNLGVGDYYAAIPESWFRENSKEPLFYDEKGEQFGGMSLSQVDLGENKAETFENTELPLPNHSQILQRKVLKEEGKTFIILKTAHQNYILMHPDITKDDIFMIWAGNGKIQEGKLFKIARTLKKVEFPQGYQPETTFLDDWDKTAEQLLNRYFQNYADTKLPVSSDISGYRIDHMEPYQNPDPSWSLIYPGTAVYRVDYTLNIAYPDQYSFPDGGSKTGQGKKTKTFQNQLAVFCKDTMKKTTFLGFVWQQDIGELGETKAILRTIDGADQNQSPAALLKLKTPYIGNHVADGKILSALPLRSYSTGLELHTKQEPYGLTVSYDLTKLGNQIFKSRPDKAPEDSIGWELNPYLKAQFDKNSAILLSLIDNCSKVEFIVKGMSETGVPYSYYYWADRQTLTKELSKDPREFAKSQESFTEFMNLLENGSNGNE